MTNVNTIANTNASNLNNVDPRFVKQMTFEQAAVSVIPTMAVLMIPNYGHLYFEGHPKALAFNAMAMFHALSAFVKGQAASKERTELCFAEGAKSTIRANNEKEVRSEHIYQSPAVMVEMARMMNWLEIHENGYMATERWFEMFTTAASLRPQHEKITKENRRTPLVKGNKIKNPCLNYMNAIEFLQDRAYHVEQPMLNIINEVSQLYINNPVKWKSKRSEGRNQYPSTISSEMYVLTGSRENHDVEELYSEWKGDSRSRKYQAACAGPNAQAGDMARALDSHNVYNWVSKDSYAYQYFFMLELADCAGKGNNKEWQQHDRLMWVAQNPVKALKRILDYVHFNEEEHDRSKHHCVPNKPFMYIRMVLDWYKFETEGGCDSRISFGEDAKCSGTQYLAILAGDVKLMNATGLIESFDTKPADPYIMCKDHFAEILKNSQNFHMLDLSFNTRDYMKTPYMAVQYSGGVPALIKNKDFMYPLVAQGITSATMHKRFCELAIEAVKQTLGEKVCAFIDAVKKACENKLFDMSVNRPENPVQYFPYHLADGFKVIKPCFKKEKYSEHFTIRLNSEISISFGGKKQQTPWEVKAPVPDADTFVRTFIVNYIQGTDALIARTIADFAKQDELRGFTAIHDCFRCCLADVEKMHNTICKAYDKVFLQTDMQAHLQSQIGFINLNLENNLTKEMIYSKQAYFFTAE